MTADQWWALAFLVLPVLVGVLVTHATTRTTRR